MKNCQKPFSKWCLEGNDKKDADQQGEADQGGGHRGGRSGGRDRERSD